MMIVGGKTPKNSVLFFLYLPKNNQKQFLKFVIDAQRKTVVLNKK